MPDFKMLDMMGQNKFKNYFLDKQKKHTKKKKTIHGKFCSPDMEGRYTCFPRKALVNIANRWNKKHPADKIKIVSNVSKLWKNINSRLRKQCSTEKCWGKIADEDTNKYFRPTLPKEWVDKPYEWLSTPDIEKVMKQYEKKYPDFVFIGPVPMDFDSQDSVGQCIVDELCQLDLVNMFNRGKYRIGIIFNLDYHNQPGSHWVAMFVSMIYNDPNFGIHYFDSYASTPPTEVQNLAKRLIEQGKAIDFFKNKKAASITKGGDESTRDFNFTYNKLRHQFKNSECGVYCLNFINESLQSLPRRKVRLSDDAVHRLRKELFYYPREKEQNDNQNGGGKKFKHTLKNSGKKNLKNLKKSKKFQIKN